MPEHSRTQKIISFEAATRLVNLAVAHADSNGWAVAVVVVDPSGQVVASGRMDGVPGPVIEFAADKAYTAILGKSTQAFFERMSSSPELEMGVMNRSRLCAWDGGVPAIDGGMVIGAIGVSGAAGPDDVACAEAALSELGLLG